jgi:hypothetical protein
VQTFDVGDLSCGGAASGTVTVTWTTDAATAVEIAVDGEAPSGYGPSGSADVDVPCDGASHMVTITPRSDSGDGAPESTDVSSG